MGESHEIAAGAARSAFSGASQHNRPMQLDFPFKDGPPAILLPNKLAALDEVSRRFRFEVEVLSDDPRIPLKILMGRMVTISLVREDGSLRYFSGYITEFRFLRSDGGFAFYQMLLEPWLAFARLRKDSRSFHNKSVREITEETLRHYRQADWHMHSTIDDSKPTVANQYNETNYNHLHRRWEALGSLTPSTKTAPRSTKASPTLWVVSPSNIRAGHRATQSSWQTAKSSSSRRGKSLIPRTKPCTASRSSRTRARVRSMILQTAALTPELAAN